MTRHWTFCAAWGLSLVMTIVGRAAEQRTGRPGDPLAGISTAELEEFRLGLEDFLEVETAEDGLGPAFNGTSCAVCHNVPAVGGAGLVSELRGARLGADGQPAAFDADGSTLFHLFSVPGHGCQPQIPADVVVVARRAPIPLFGAGLVEAIPDETILALADPDDRNRDGISGRAAVVIDRVSGRPRVGRFGWKSQIATLRAFAGDAYRNEMGITNEVFPTEMAFGISADAMRLCDPFPDPEDRPDRRTRRTGVDNFTSFMTLLAPVAAEPLGEDGRAGERLFTEIGCAQCHVPALRTGASSNPVFHDRLVPLFSDLLLHDVGTGDGIPQEAARPEEIRTPALWGLRLRRPLMHDGATATPRDAILRHAGEAAAARARFSALTVEQHRLLLVFLGRI